MEHRRPLIRCTCAIVQLMREGRRQSGSGWRPGLATVLGQSWVGWLDHSQMEGALHAWVCLLPRSEALGADVVPPAAPESAFVASAQKCALYAAGSRSSLFDVHDICRCWNLRLRSSLSAEAADRVFGQFESPQQLVRR